MKYNPSKKGKYGKWMGNCEKNQTNKGTRAGKEKNRKKTRREEERQGKETRNCVKSTKYIKTSFFKRRK